ETVYTNKTDSESDSNNMPSSTSTLASTKKKRNRSKKSFMWKYFTVVETKDEKKDVCQVMVKKKGEDKKCEVEYIHNNSTSNIIAHLRSHNIIDNKKQKSEIQQNKQTTLTELIRSNIPHKVDKQKELNKAVVEWILLDNQPLSAPRKKGFRCMITKFDPRFRPPSDRVIKNEIAFSYLKNIDILRHEIKQSCKTATITTDLWTSHNNQGYIGSNLISTEPYFEEEETGEVNDGVKLDNITDATPIQSISSTSTTSTNRYFASIFDNNDDDNLLNNKSELDKYLEASLASPSK
ncbi:9122_t:CDS:2, partial [Cetraspora pellucida]